MAIPPAGKRVQEISAEAAEPPPRFFVKDNGFGGGVSSAQVADIPVIDLNLLLGTDPDAKEAEFTRFKSALNFWGCFQLIGHGMSNLFLEKVRGVGKEFFSLPMKEKEKYVRSTQSPEGYGNDSVLAENQILDWCDRLFLKIYPQNQTDLHFWPQTPPDFSEIMHEYSRKMKGLVDELLKMMAKSLDIEEDGLLNLIGDEPTLEARFNFYPKCPKADWILGVKAHADSSAFTILLQDKEVEGLQVLMDGKWYSVPVLPHALVVNLGDQMQLMSNGMLKSLVHRAAVSSTQERMSLAVFFTPDADKEIGPAEGLVNAERPRLYRSVKNYRVINMKCFQSGEIPIDTLKI
ncbi:probable 2-oxoglutarate-dependent dioxygenase ANS [Ipomoea triloba]|uniref:probable 2-oxoglutarate-dependent dioxygenase ANS n=1 Tax=Ipomoea triloba TaxID=35885 RepID=UPI00125E6CD0|nr:probable 2-oxoglutarate-dependent dioxygenase ANS [Ipomoea triloba]